MAPLPVQLVLHVVLAVPQGAVIAQSTSPPDQGPAEPERPAKIRTGVVLGVALGVGVGGASGYPNNATEIGNPAYYAASGAMPGSSLTLLAMGALSDYLNVGFWFSRSTFANSDWRSEGDAGGLRIDAFPFVTLVPRLSALSGLGLFGQFGIGGGNLRSTIAGGPESSGTQSFAAGGVLYEWSFWHFGGGHFGAGPSLDYEAIWSHPFERHGLVAQGRFVFYGGP
jgi:hypothetical protein